MFPALLLSAIVSSACALLLKAVNSSSSACAVTIPVMTPGRQRQRCRYDAADHPAQLGLVWEWWGAA
jgi:hypothetical protein